MSLTTAELATIQSASDVVSSLSLLGSACILCCYARYAALRKNAFTLVACLSLSDVLNHVADFVGPPPADLAVMVAPGAPISPACWAQALGNAVFELSSVLWTSAIAATLYAQVMLAIRPERMERAFYAISAFCWGLPLVLALLPLTQGLSVYGASGSWCWIRAAFPGWIFAIFYAPLWLCMFLNVLVHVRIKARLEAMIRGGAASTDAATAAKLALVIERLKWYPFVLIVVWAPASISRIVEAALGRPLFGLVLFHRLFSSSQGLLNAAAYGLSRGVREALHADAFRLFPQCVAAPAVAMEDGVVTAVAADAGGT